MSAWNDLGHISRAWVHPSFGVPLVVEDPNGVKTTTTIDDMGRRIEVSPDGGAKVAWSFSSLTEGRSRVHTSSATGSAAEVDLDALGRPARARYKGFDGSWIEAETTYDVLGRVASQSRPGVGAPSPHKSSYVYDLLGRVVDEVAPDGATTTHTYSFFATHTWDPKLNETATLFDVDGRVSQRVELIGHEALATTFAYGAFGQLDTITDPKGNVTSMGYDHLGRRTWIHEPNAGLHVSTYNGFSQRTAELPPAALPISYEYDAIGRLEQRTDADGVTSFTWDTAAHGLGKLAGTSSTDGVKEVYSYDTKGRLAWRMLKTGGEHFAFDYHYDAQGRLDTLLYPEVPGLPRFSIGHTYNSAGYLKTVFDASTLTKHKLWMADDAGPDGILQATLGNGLLQGRQYDPTTGRLSALQEGPDVSLGCTYDAAGLVSTRTDYKTNRQDGFEYDALHRLVHWSRSSIIQGPPGVPPAVSPLRDTQYTFDNLGNLTTVVENGALTESHTYAQNGMPHAVTSNTFGAYTYDARGRQTKAPGRDVTFTERDLPRTVTTNAGVTSFLYDASGARIKKQSATEEVLTFGGLYERKVSATGTRHVFYVAGGEGLVARFDYEEGAPSTEARYLHTDALGSVIAVTDAAGALVERLHYEPFGGRRDQDGAALSAFSGDPSLGFTGHEHDDELGLINMRGRVMDPITRRFLTPDPHVTDPFRSQSYNRFSYVINSPTNLIDPTGFDWWPTRVASGLAIGALNRYIAKSHDALMTFQFTVATGGGYLLFYKIPAGIYGALASAYDAYTKGGALGLFVSAHPAYAFARPWISAYAHIQAGDYQAAGGDFIDIAEGVATLVVGGVTAAKGGPPVGEVPQMGGAYSRVRAMATEGGLGGQVHHIPSWAAMENAGAQGITYRNAPSIWMEAGDHVGTRSHGWQGNAGAEYRAMQGNLIKNGQYLDAMKMDVQSIRARFGPKYDVAIQQMGEYFWKSNQ